MKLHDNQSFLSLYYAPNRVEVATGELDPFTAIESWKGDSKQMGQVATPEPIATTMAKWVMAQSPHTVLDPAAGLGGLLHACNKLNERSQFVGVERDVNTLQQAKRTAPRGTKLILADYLKSENGAYGGIIANPPYIKAQRLDYTEKDWCYFEERFGTPLNRLTNLYALFLLKIWEDLKIGGRAAVILPAEFLNANFGEEIKDRLVYEIRPTALAVFDPSVSIFANALTTSAILFLERGRKANAPSLAKRVRSVAEVDRFLSELRNRSNVLPPSDCLDLNSLNPHDKWLNMLFNGRCHKDEKSFPNYVGDYFTCSRGIATGANDYFCLSRTELQLQLLSQDHVDPCVTKAMDAEGLVFTKRDFESLVMNDRRCFLLNPSGDNQDLRRYLKRGEEKGIPERHLPSHRPVWYLPENRSVADIWAAVFSRGTTKFILNTSKAKNLTCFHGLYVKPGCDNLPPLMTLFLNSSKGHKAYSQVNRFYGDGLNKLEPKDVEEMPCPVMPLITKTEANELTRKLQDLEKLPLIERTASLDKLANLYFGIF